MASRPVAVRLMAVALMAFALIGMHHLAAACHGSAEVSPSSAQADVAGHHHMAIPAPPTTVSGPVATAPAHPESVPGFVLACLAVLLLCVLFLRRIRWPGSPAAYVLAGALRRLRGRVAEPPDLKALSISRT